MVVSLKYCMGLCICVSQHDYRPRLSTAFYVHGINAITVRLCARTRIIEPFVLVLTENDETTTDARSHFQGVDRRDARTATLTQPRSRVSCCCRCDRFYYYCFCFCFCCFFLFGCFDLPGHPGKTSVLFLILLLLLLLLRVHILSSLSRAGSNRKNEATTDARSHFQGVDRRDARTATQTWLRSRVSCCCRYYRYYYCCFCFCCYGYTHFRAFLVLV